MFRKFTDYWTIKDKVRNYKALKDYTDDELYEFIDKNENTDTGVLAGICSEILRRQKVRNH